MRLLIVDDHEVVRRGIRSLLSEQAGWNVCGEAVDGQDAIEKACQLKPDLIVMDVSMPRLNGLEATRQVRSILPDCEVLVLSQHENPEMARQALKAGARGYVVKSSISRDLLSAVAKASTREYFFDPAILDQTTSSHTDVQEILQRSTAFEKALRDSEERLQKLAEYQSAVMNNMAEGLYAVNENGLLTSINPAGEAILGWKRDELIGKKMHDVTHYKHPDGIPFPASDCPGLQVLQKGIALREHEDTFIRKDGTFVPVVFSASPLKEDGKIAGVIVSFRDDTEQRRAREALRDSKEQLVLALQSSKSAMFDWDVIQRSGNWNSQMAALYGFQPQSEYITSEEWITLFHPEDAERLRREAEQFWKQGDEFYFEFRTAPRNGNVKWISSHGRIVRDANGNAVRMIGTHSDISERKQSETSLAAGARQQKALFHLADELHRAGSMDEVYNAALNAILDALQCNRASILLCDDAEIMRFKSWRGLSNEYRAATDGHSAWRPDERNPQPVCIPDIGTADLTESLKAVVKREGIRSLAFIPLVSDGKLNGKFMAYFNTPHQFTPDEIDLSLTIARQLTFAIDRKRNDDALEQSKKATALLAAIVASSDDAIVSKNLNGIIQCWNNGAERIFGYTATEAIGQHITFIIPPDRHGEEDDILARLRRGERIDHFQTVRRRKDGTLIDVSVTISPVRNSSGRVVGASKVARDITAQKRAEQALRESEQRYQVVTDASPIMIWMSGTDKLCYYFNKGWLDFVGRTLEQEVGNGWVANVHPDDFDRCLQIYASNFDARRAFEMEYRLRHQTGQYRWILDRGIPRHAPDGTFEGYVGGCLDIHDRKEAAEKVRGADETLRLMKIQDEQSRRFARELHDSAGQTLTVLGLSLAQLVERADLIAPELAKQGREIEEVVQQLHREIRTTSYLLHPPLLDECGLSSALNWYVQGVAERSGVRIDLSMADDFGRLPADMELAIFRMVQECLTNIHRHAESKTAFIQIARESGNVCVNVRDDGKGISPERLADIQSRGSGVGIGGIRERLRQFNGELQIESNGSGTSVIVSIPMPKETRSAAGEPLQAVV